MYYTVLSFAKTYDRFQADIQAKVQYSNTLSLICIGVIVVCSIGIVPLLFRIGQRALILMRIFFQLDSKRQVRNNIVSIEQFQKTLKDEEGMRRLKNFPNELDALDHRI